MYGPLDFESREFQARCQIRRLAYLTNQSSSQVICDAIGEYYRQILAQVTEEQLRAEDAQWQAFGTTAAIAARYADGTREISIPRVEPSEAQRTSGAPDAADLRDAD